MPATIINPNLKNYLEKRLSFSEKCFYFASKKQNHTGENFLRKGIENCKAHISDDDIQQIFRELGLYSPDPNEHTQLWWNRARNFVRYEEGIENTMTGDKGEIESYRYELARTGITPTLVAQESENYGYDLESVVDSENLEPIYIEIKSSKIHWSRARMFFSSGEYKVMRKHPEKYRFHLWDLSDKSNPLLLVVKSVDVQKHIPSNTRRGEWRSVEIPFSAFDWEE